MCHFPEVIYHRQKNFLSLKVNNAESVLGTYNMLHIHCHKFGWTLHVQQPLQHRCTQPFHQLWHLKWNKLGELATCRPPATFEKSQTDEGIRLTVPTHEVHTLNIFYDQQPAVILKACYLDLTVFLYCGSNPKVGCAFFIHHVYLNMETCVRHCASCEQPRLLGHSTTCMII
jgi:hypothetical protein